MFFLQILFTMNVFFAEKMAFKTVFKKKDLVRIGTFSSTLIEVDFELG